MAGAKKRSVKLGDVFSICIADELYSYGQVVCKGLSSDCMVIYDLTSRRNPNVDEIVKYPVIFVAQTVSVRIEDGNWAIIGNTEVPSHIVLPQYITETPEGHKVLGNDGRILRAATEKDLKKLSTLKSCSPAILEDAVRARYGAGKWYPYLDNLTYVE